jgi:F-type H+-transporting ATPase subunit delta
VQESAVALKYARALFDAAIEEDRVNETAADMASVGKLAQQDASFLGFLVSPEVLTEHKLEFIQSVFASRLSPLVVNYLRLLVNKTRINFLPEMCEEFVRLVEEHRGILRAEVLTAVPMDQDQETKLRDRLSRITGKEILLEKRVDPQVLGGVVVHLGNKILDGSLRHDVKLLREKLLHAQVN